MVDTIRIHWTQFELMTFSKGPLTADIAMHLCSLIIRKHLHTDRYYNNCVMGLWYMTTWDEKGLVFHPNSVTL